MNVLMAFDYNPNHSNPFVRTLADAIKMNGVSIDCSLSAFWSDWNKYDIIHIQWVHSLLYPNHNIDQLKNHLQLLKQSHKIILVTCHNFKPHYTTDDSAVQAYELVYSMSDCIVHMGSYSKAVMEKNYPYAKHIIIPHHIYDGIYKDIPTKNESLKKLKLSDKYKYILCFGAFRDDEERDMINIIAEAFAKDGFAVLAPSFFSYPISKRFWITISGFIRSLIYRCRYPKIIFANGYVPVEKLPFYYSASEFALIQRKHILNSRNLPMALMMGKVVVGGNLGNLGSELRRLGNPTFDVDNVQSMMDAINKGILMAHSGIGEMNRKYAYENLTSMKIGAEYVELYHTLAPFE